MAVRYYEPINFTATCNISGVDALAVGRCTDGPRELVLVAHDIIEAACQFVDFKFGTVPRGDGAFVWSTNGYRPDGAVSIDESEVGGDCNRFFRLMKYYEQRLCG